MIIILECYIIKISTCIKCLLCTYNIMSCCFFL